MKNYVCSMHSYLAKSALFCLSAVSMNAFASTYAVNCNSPQEIQASLKTCSDNGYTCVIPSATTCTATGPLYMWGNASLSSSNGGGIKFNQTTTNPYLFNLGISGPQVSTDFTANLAPAFTGKISNITFTMDGANGSGRIIYFWRSNGATVSNNTFNLGTYDYSATSSGNNNNWVYNGAINSIRQNVTISNNIINATSAGGNKGSEGIGLGQFTTATVQGNTINGVGDDGIGIHFCSGVKILNNVLRTTHGRIFVSNSDHVEIAYNTHTRIASLADGVFYQGISLLYVGFETYAISAGDTTQYYAPSDINVHDNKLYYNAGAIDAGAAIYLYASRGASTVNNNLIVNNSNAKGFTAVGLHLLPALVSGWVDPTGIDPINDPRVHNAIIDMNVSAGNYPLALVMTGNCVEYVGQVNVTNNIGPAAGTTGIGSPGYQFYCLGYGVTATGNKDISPAPGL